MHYFSQVLLIALILSLTAMPALAEAIAPTRVLEQQAAALTIEFNRLKAHAEERSGAPTLSKGRIDEIIKNGLSWLLSSQEESGHFRYEYAPYENRFLNGDNIVRQTGAFYQLGEMVRRKKGDASRVEEAMVRSIGYFEKLSRKGTYDGVSFRCITEEEMEEENGARCKLGATALALVGILSLAERSEKYRDEYDDLIASYAAFLEAMQKENGGFRNLFSFRSDVQSGKESSFSTGEALLALVRYQKQYPTKATKKQIDDAFTYINISVPYDTALYLWAMAAVVDLYRQDPRTEYEVYAKAYTDWRIKGFAGRRGTGHNMCAYTEGIVLGYDTIEEFLPPEALASYRNEIAFWLSQGSTLQVGKDDNSRVLFSKSGPTFVALEEPSKAYGGFLTSDSVLTQRIDFTQHCLNAYLVWNDIRGSDLK